MTDGTATAGTFKSKLATVTAIQFNGPDSLLACQAFLAPSSPAYNAMRDSKIPTPTLYVFTRNLKDEAKWPSLGTQYAMVACPVGGWIIRHANGDVEICESPSIFEERFDAVDAGDGSAARMPSTAIGDAIDRHVDGFGGGGQLKATHPRAAAQRGAERQFDRQPATDAAGGVPDADSRD